MKTLKEEKKKAVQESNKLSCKKDGCTLKFKEERDLWTHMIGAHLETVREYNDRADAEGHKKVQILNCPVDGCDKAFYRRAHFNIEILTYLKNT